MSAGAAFICAFLEFFLKLHNLNIFFNNAEREMGMRVGFVTFVYVPIPDPPLE